MIALKGVAKLTILHLAGPSLELSGYVNDFGPDIDYGTPENYGKVFDLNSSVDR